ncbi:hypothetical protein PSEUDO8AS_50063 [Pseudomonas sp. 8AS]|uniref:hypothetical protein n=1 Tax=Pseudomonas sp. 8AS TaxID=2653163 RepID=UPI0012EF4847|nr:hypothetical protein [Pseudomonas sp. 8AS]VXC10340.1 hypothetical protein PSEUDO8AS_50063 [Pseudomonas sp. 8AS]
MSHAVASVSDFSPSPFSRLRGRTVLVVDATASRSRACTLRLLQGGASLLLMGQRAPALQQLRAELLAAAPAGRVECCVGDAREPAQLRLALQHAYGMQRRLDLLLVDGTLRTKGGRIVMRCPQKE